MKKKILGIGAFVVACLSSVLMLAGCGTTEKTFSSDDGISITLTNEFQEYSMYGYSLALSTADKAFLAEKVVFNTQGTDENWTEQEYAQAIVDSNSLDTMSDVFVDGERNLVYFYYTNVSQGNNFYYLAVAKKGTDAFWLCQFSCYETRAEAYKTQFLDWATTIEVL